MRRVFFSFFSDAALDSVLLQQTMLNNKKTILLLRDAELENNFVAVLTFGAQVHEPHFDTTQQHVSEAMVLFKSHKP